MKPDPITAFMALEGVTFVQRLPQRAGGLFKLQLNGCGAMGYGTTVAEALDNARALNAEWLDAA